MNDWKGVWKRLGRGEHVVLEGTGAIPRPDPAELRLVIVDCEAFPGPRGPLEEARRRLDQALSAPLPPPFADARARALSLGLRDNLLGGPAERLDLARYFQAFVSVPRAGGAPLALILRGVDRSDPETLELLASWVRADAPKLPLLMSFETDPRSPAAQRLFEHLSRVLPPEAFLRLGALDEPGPASSLGPVLRELPAPMLEVLRAAATLGDRFESEVLAELLDLEELAVLSTLQAAVDRGLSIQDRGHGLFRFDSRLAHALRESTLPSLSRAWHERLARLFGGLPAPLPTHAEPPRDADARAEAPAPKQKPLATPPAERVARPEPRASAPRDGDFFAIPTPGVRPLDPRQDEWYRRLETELQSAPVSSVPQSSVPARGLQQPREDMAGPAASQPRAARHAEAAGLWDAACEQHLAAAESASRAGSHHAALEHSARARMIAEQLGNADRVRRAEIVSLLVTGRARWQSRGVGPEGSLPAALDALMSCRALLAPSDPPELRAELGTLLAGVQYDIGTPESLEHALREMTQSSQLLLDAGRPLDAARLLNDEAAIWVKLGDPVRANHLLSRSREVFSKVANSYPPARVELAETEHLLARLLLHATARPGREQDALQLGIEHGRAAEEAYRELNDAQQLARVWETLARLHLRLGRLDVAAELLENARRVQEQLGDGVGLARSSAAAAEVLAEAQDYPRALDRLSDSIELNAEKGLRAGLEFNLASLRHLERRLPSDMQRAARALERRLSEALGASREASMPSG